MCNIVDQRHYMHNNIITVVHIDGGEGALSIPVTTPYFLGRGRKGEYFVGENKSVYAVGV